MKKNNILTIVVAAVAGLVAGFLLANTINRNEINVLRAENETFKRGGGTTAAPAANADSSLTVEEINTAIQRADGNPGDFQTQRNIGTAIYRYATMKQDAELLQQSARLLERAVELRPTNYDTMVTLAHAYFDHGYFSKNNDSLIKARSLYEKSLAVEPDDAGVITDLGLTYFLQTPPDYDRAVGEFNKALAKDARHEKALQYMVETLIKQNKQAEASSYLEKLRAVNPQNQSIGDFSAALGTQPAG